MTEEKEVMEIDLLKLAKALWRRAWIIAIVAVLGAVIALSYTKLFVTPLYTSSTMAYVNNKSINVGSASVSLASGDISASKYLVDTYIVILRSRTMLEEVIAETGVEYTYEQLRSMISASAVNNTEIFEIKVTSPDPAEAQKIVNTIAVLLPEKVSSIVEGTSVRIVDYGVMPTKRTSPSYSRNTIIGFLLGAVAVCAVVVVLELLDDVVHSEDFLTQNYSDIPLLAVIPDMEARSKSRYGYGQKYGYGYGYSSGENAQQPESAKKLNLDRLNFKKKSDGGKRKGGTR